MASDQQLSTDLANKLKFESKLRIKIKKFLKQINKDANVIWRATGTLPDFRFYITDLTAILREHYRGASNKFSRTIRDSIKNKNIPMQLERKEEIEEELELEGIEEEGSKIDEAILTALLLYIATHSSEQARIILDTIESDYNKIVDSVLPTSIADGEDPTREQVADKITKDFGDKIDGKTTIISQTENQDIAEESKLIEARVIAASALLVGGIAIASRMNKIWNSVFLPTTRAHHASADGQRAKLDQPFIVKGQQLMRPSDTSLGATADNIINCYCFTTFEIV